MSITRFTGVVCGCLFAALVCGCRSDGRIASAQKTRPAVDPQVHAARVGLLFESQGNLEMAKKTYERAAVEYPDDPQFAARLEKLKGSERHATSVASKPTVQQVFSSFDRSSTQPSAKFDTQMMRESLSPTSGRTQIADSRSGQPVTTESSHAASFSPPSQPVSVGNFRTAPERPPTEFRRQASTPFGTQPSGQGFSTTPISTSQIAVGAQSPFPETPSTTQPATADQDDLVGRTSLIR